MRSTMNAKAHFDRTLLFAVLTLLVIGVVMAIVGAMYWGVIFDRRGPSQYIRKRLPPE